jgi:hypothetical protein
MAFTWWLVVDGVAHARPDTAETRALVDAGKGQWFGSIEGAILHGGVRATAFERKTEQLYDAAAWLHTGAMVPAGFATTTQITAERA